MTLFKTTVKHCLGRQYRRWLVWFATVWCWLGTAGVALAKKSAAPKAPEVAEKEYVLPYALVMMLVALGMIVVCRASSRGTQPKTDEEEEE